jgi:pyruvate,water dikinase
VSDYVIKFEQLRISDVDQVGGKNASLGEMIHHLASAGVDVPGGFATTAAAYREFLAKDGLAARIDAALDALDVDDVRALAATGKQIRQWVMEQPFPAPLTEAISTAYLGLEQDYGDQATFAVRSSATAEDLPDASFAGQQETLLNVRGLDDILRAIHEVFASLYNDRAIAYRVHQGFDHKLVALSAGVQRMIRSDLSTSGVMFTLDTDSGFREVVFVTASYGLGEMVVQGAVNPDEFYVHKPGVRAGRPAVVRRGLGAKAIKMTYGEQGQRVKTVDVDEYDRNRFCISDADVEALARQALTIEEHYGRPMDIEWAKDGIDGKLYIVQARPETVQSRATNQVERYKLKQRGEILDEGRSIGQRIGSGPAKVIRSLDEMDKVQQGDVLVADMTDPDWEPIMKRASAIVTNRGGRTCHAAIIARELGVPAVVGCGDATSQVPNGMDVTVSCAEGDTGYVYKGLLDFDHTVVSLETMPEVPVKVMMNVGNPERAFDFAQLPSDGIGLARLEFIVSSMIGIHPKALLAPDKLSAEETAEVQRRTGAYGSPTDYYVGRLVEGVASIAAAVYPKPVIVRLSDFKSNEYYNLLGGHHFEPQEENPMIGFRGAARYVSEDFRPCFDLECRAMKYVRDEMGLTNVQLMVPFVRTVAEAEAVVKALAENGLQRGDNELKLIMMCELPSNAVLAEQFLEHFDGFSIGSNDLTQLTLGLDRDSGLVAASFDERNPAVLYLIDLAITACKAQGKYVGICGQGPSDHPDLARWLLERGISSISLNPDTVVDTWLFLAGEKVDG